MSFFLYLAPQFHALRFFLRFYFFYFYLLLKNRFYLSIFACFITKVDFAILGYLKYYFILFWWCFHTIAENLHDIHPHQTARPPVRAKKRESEISAMVIIMTPPRRACPFLCTRIMVASQSTISFVFSLLYHDQLSWPLVLLPRITV